MTLLALQDLLSALSSDAPLGKIMHALCCEIERVAPEVVASVLLLDENKRIRPLASPSLPDSYDKAIDGTFLGANIGTCSVAMTYARPHLTHDIEQDPNWNGVKHLVAPLGLRTCWSHPIKRRDGLVLGSLAFYFKEPTQPSDFHESLAKVSLNLCTLAFEHEEAQHNIQKLAYFDTLTSLPNRAMLRKELKRVLAQARRGASPFALIFIDLDNFKEINDKHGHLVGDDVLCQIGRRLQRCVRAGDFVGRLGGDEFLAIIDHGDAGLVDTIAQRILESLHQPLAIASAPSPSVYVTASLGVSFYPEDGRDIDTLLNNADTAMYKSKRAGKNQTTFFRKPAAPQTAARADDAAPAADQNAHAAAQDTRYGPLAYAAMEGLSQDIPTVVNRVVEQFYGRLAALPGVGHLIECLSPGEIQHLKTMQARNLTLLCSPGLTCEQHKELALQSGRVHAIIGLSHDPLLASYDLLYAILRDHVNVVRHAMALSVLIRRLIHDMMCQMASAQVLQLARQKTLLRLSDLCWNAESYTDLILKTAEILIELDGVDGCVFMRPDERGIFQIEALTGRGTPDMIGQVTARQVDWLEHGEDPMQISSVTARAWKNGHIERCLNYATDPRVAPWKEIVTQAGYASSITLPLTPPNGRTPKTALAIYSRLPGGFSAPEQDVFFTQIKTLLSFGIGRLENHKGPADSILYTTRTHWQDLLRGPGLEMHYQPIVNPHTEQTRKVEALVRLRDSGKILAPATFFPALSSEDFYVIFERGLDLVLQQRAEWVRQRRMHLDVTLNLPTSALGDPRYVEATRRALIQHDCPPRALTLELLETGEIPRGTDMLAALGAYKRLGVCLAEDDLGSGHGALTRLRELPFDILKIDRSIVRQADKDPYDTLRFIYQLTRLGHSLGKQVIVEGVEDPALLSAVALLGPNYVQGYAIARPMPAATLAGWFDQRHDMPGAPPSGNALSRLADALIWEEGLHVIYKETPGLKAKDAMLGEMYANMLNKPAASAEELTLRMNLVHCAQRCGLRGKEYLQARGRLVSLLMHGSGARPSLGPIDAKP